MNNIDVSDIMTREPITIPSETNLFECAKKMVRRKTGSLLITKKDELLGIISMKDILWALIKKSPQDLPKIKAIDISPRKIITIKPNATIDEAFSKMKKTKLERLPVVQGKKLVGLITTRDILNFHPEFYPEFEEFARIREESRKLKMVEKAKKEYPESNSPEGICEECGNFGILIKSNGALICESCFDEKN
jgi:CBS domain-containing protein